MRAALGCPWHERRCTIGSNRPVGANVLAAELKEFPDNGLIAGSPGHPFPTLEESAQSVRRATLVLPETPGS